MNNVNLTCILTLRFKSFISFHVRFTLFISKHICMTVWLYHICSFLQMNSSPSRMDSLTPFRGLQSRHEKSPQSPQQNWEAATDRNNKRANDRFKGNLEDCLGLRVSQNLFGNWDLFHYFDYVWFIETEFGTRPEWKASTWWQNCWELSDEFVEAMTSSVHRWVCLS